MDQALFEKFAAAEDEFINSEFFSPVLRGHPVRVKINKVNLSLKIVKPKNFAGWGVFRPNSFKEAVFVRQPTLSEKQHYYSLFPELRFILCRRVNNAWYGVPSHLSDNRFKITGLVPIQLVEEAQMFDTIQVRFDGELCWYEGIFEKHTSKNAIYLRESLNQFLDPKKLVFSGLTKEEHEAYNSAYIFELQTNEALKKSREEQQIKNALTKAGARYRSHIERNDSYTIEFTVDGSNYKSSIKKGNLEVQSAGICLSGGDRAFDLQSLVGVIREGQNRHLIHRY